MKIDKVIFGDNQFFGVDHLSEEKAKEKSDRFSDDKEIFKVLDSAHEVGIRTFMCTTYPRIKTICEYFKKHPSKFDDWKVYPCMPYAHKYANALTEYGVLGTINLFTNANYLKSIYTNITALLRQDATQAMKLLVDAELSFFKGVNTEAIFIQNVVTDLILGLGMDEFILEYVDYIEKKHKSKPGFITMNLPYTHDQLNRMGLHNQLICSSINKNGFRMTGTFNDNLKILESEDNNIIAMQALGAGSLKPKEAFEFVCNKPGIKSILFGASSYKHINENFNMINEISRGL